MSERKLASIQRIHTIEAIEGADRIEIVKVLGWQCVTQKSNNFKVGDKVCYFEVDSMLPARPEFEFLRKKPEETSFRLKTIRLKGKYSQGLVLPLASLFEKEGDKYFYNTLSAPGRAELRLDEGVDLTSWLGITKYEPPIPAQLRGLVLGQFPYFLAKTDETRIQSCPGVLERNKGRPMFVTEKLDGSSFTAFYYPLPNTDLPHRPADDERGYVFGVCSRNMELARSEGNSYWVTADKYEIERKLRAYNKPIAIQGEMYGVGIQKNPLKSETVNLAVFNIYDLVAKRFLNYQEFIDTCKELNLPTVPILASNEPLDTTVDQLVTRSIKKSVLNPDIWIEGLVFRPMFESMDSDLGRLSYKVINPEFLLKYD